MLYNLCILQPVLLRQAAAEVGGHKAARRLSVEPCVVAGGEVGDDGREVDGLADAAAHARLENTNGHMLHQRVD